MLGCVWMVGTDMKMLMNRDILPEDAVRAGRQDGGCRQDVRTANEEPARRCCGSLFRDVHDALQLDRRDLRQEIKDPLQQVMIEELRALRQLRWQQQREAAPLMGAPSTLNCTRRTN